MRAVIAILIVLFLAGCAYEFRYKKTVEIQRTKKPPKDSVKVKKPHNFD